MKTNIFKFYSGNRWEEVYRSFIIYLEPKFRIRQMRNRFTTRNQWFTETIETIRTSGLTLIISTIRFFKTFTAEFGIKLDSLSRCIGKAGHAIVQNHSFIFLNVWLLMA